MFVSLSFSFGPWRRVLRVWCHARDASSGFRNRLGLIERRNSPATTIRLCECEGMEHLYRERGRENADEVRLATH